MFWRNQPEAIKSKLIRFCEGLQPLTCGLQVILKGAVHTSLAVEITRISNWSAGVRLIIETFVCIARCSCVCFGTAYTLRPALCKVWPSNGMTCPRNAVFTHIIIVTDLIRVTLTPYIHQIMTEHNLVQGDRNIKIMQIEKINGHRKLTHSLACDVFTVVLRRVPLSLLQILSRLTRQLVPLTAFFCKEVHVLMSVRRHDIS